MGCNPSQSDADLSGVYMPKTLWDRTSLNVCWMHDGDVTVGTESGRAIVQAAVTSEYQRAGFQLRNWGPCTERDSVYDTIRILVTDAQPFGRFGCLDGPWCIKLNFEFNKWPHSDEKCAEIDADKAWACHCKESKNLKTCLQSYSLHEMGHALGLAHEATHRSNRKKDLCELNDGRESGSKDVGDYDADSIMNYCKNKDQILNNYRPELSEGDIKTLKTIYSNLL